MSIKVHIHNAYKRYTDGNQIVECEGKNVGECLRDLIKRYPLIRDQIFDKGGKLKNTIEIFINNASAYPDELNRRVKDGDDIFITLLLAGG